MQSAVSLVALTVAACISERTRIPANNASDSEPGYTGSQLDRQAW